MEAQKKKTPNTNIRYAFYEASDKIRALTDKAYATGDKELIATAEELLSNIKKFEKHLDSEYSWD